MTAAHIPLNPKAKLIAWLRDAHAVEGAAEKILTLHLRAAQDYPELVERLGAHRAQTQEHAARLEQLLKNLGSSPSTTENAVGKVIGSIQAAAGMMLGDAVMTNTSADYALEHLEISTYVAIIAAAETAGEQETAAVCREIVQDEERMAHWLRDYLPRLTVRYLS